MSTLTFATIPYSRPVLDELSVAHNILVESLESAQTAEQAVAVVRDWNAQRIAVSTMASLAEVHFTQNVTDEKAKNEKLFYDECGPSISELDIDFARRLIASPFRTGLSEAFGELFLTRLASACLTFDPSIKDLLIRESELCRLYNELTASAKITVDGTVYNLSTIAKLLISLDRIVRQHATTAMYEFLTANGAEIDGIFNELVAIRHEKAQRLGFSSYTEFRYVEFGRVDYNADDVERFRAQVREFVVPLASRLRSAQKHRLGLDSLTLADEKLQFADGNPVAAGDHDWIVERAHLMYSELSKETSEFFQLMLDADLLDLKSRDNKATGGYCTSFSLHGLPFIFANFNKTTHDIEVLTHEAGHAFQAYRSRNLEVPEYFWPTAEACEVHSMGMEFLTWPWMEQFFGEETDKFRFYHLQGALLILPYICAVDHFQHWVYAHPTATALERNSAWLEMEKTYLPWREAEGYPAAQEGRAWQYQRHIFETPFYYIDYALAQTCALQYWKWAERDRPDAFASYLAICDIGGSKTFLEILKAGGLTSPFDEGSLKGIVEHVYSWLAEHYPSHLVSA